VIAFVTERSCRRRAWLLLLAASTSNQLLGAAEDPDARFSAKRYRARDSAAVGAPAGGVRRVLPRDSERAVLVALAIAEAIAA